MRLPGRPIDPTESNEKRQFPLMMRRQFLGLAVATVMSAGVFHPASVEAEELPPETTLEKLAPGPIRDKLIWLFEAARAGRKAEVFRLLRGDLPPSNNQFHERWWASEGASLKAATLAEIKVWVRPGKSVSVSYPAITPKGAWGSIYFVVTDDGKLRCDQLYPASYRGR